MKKLSKYMSLLLRHKPEQGNLILDPRGFVHIDDLLAALNKHPHHPIVRSDLEELTKPSNDPNVKTRFEIEGDYIRAGHGHSVPISGYEEIIPTADLYHATPAENVSIILTTGLKSMNRDKVHLSYDKEITVEAARRRSKSIVLIKIERAAGIRFYKSADKRIILSDDIPPEYLSQEIV